MHRVWNACPQGSRFSLVPGLTSSKQTTHRPTAAAASRESRSTGRARMLAASAPRRSSKPSSRALSAS